MGMWDIDDLEELSDEDVISDAGEELDENMYLANPKTALQLVSKIIPCSVENKKADLKIKRLKEVLNEYVLHAFRNVKLENEAQLQVKLAGLGEKLYDQKKYGMLSDKIVVGIGGKFSAGKSRFINSLLKTRHDLLPEDQNPTTSIPTYIVRGDAETISAFTSHGNRVQLDYDALQALTHKFYAKYKMGFSNFIGNLILEVPDLPFDNLAFLDTPGYSKADITEDSGKKQRAFSDRSKAYEQLKNVDYLIWLVDIENGTLSETDVEFISELKLDAPMLIVVNKADKKIDSEIERVVNTITDVAKDAGLNLFDVVAYSSRDNQEWKKTQKIKLFLDCARKQEKKYSDNVSVQFHKIKKDIDLEIEHILNENMQENNALKNIIFESTNVIEIKTIVEVYGDTISYINRVKKSRKVYNHSIFETEKLIKKVMLGD